MDSIKSIPKPKSRLLLFLLTAMISVVSFLSLQKPLTVHADEDYTALARSIVDSVGSSGTGGTNTVKNGVTYARTGYLCYLLGADGSRVDLPAYAFKSSTFDSAAIPNSKWYATSRKSGLTVNGWKGVADWSVPAWESSGATNEPQIKAWFEGMDAEGDQNGMEFVFNTWGLQPALDFKAGETVIVIETLMNLQFSIKQGTSSQSVYDVAIAQVDLMSEAELLIKAELAGLDSIVDAYNNSTRDAEKSSIYKALVDNVKSAIRKLAEEDETGGTGLYQLVGDPVIGTPSNLLKYKDALGLDWHPFKSYLNKVACFAERIDVNGAGQKAGFTPWTGSTSSQISDSDVHNYGLAMMVISAVEAGQTTCDESKDPDPHDPPEESEGNCTIIKSYRTKSDTETIDDGTFYTKQVANNIIIEDESNYSVIGWKASTTEKLNISSLTWEYASGVPSLIGETGTSPASVELPDSHKYLYVLLEKNIADPEEPDEANYILTQSTIARHITLNNPDAKTVPGSDMTILGTDITFKWNLPGVSDSCSGHSCVPVTGGCKCGGHTHSHTASGCSKSVDTSKCSKSEHLMCTYATCGEYEGDVCANYHEHTDSCKSWSCGKSETTEYCSSLTGCTNKTCDKSSAAHKCIWGKWKDGTVQRGLKRTNTSAYQRIIASNDSIDYNKVTKNNVLWAPTYTRPDSNKTALELATTGFDFHTILHRGDTQIVIADWKNVDATYLEDISPGYNYTVDNNITGRTGTAKNSDYTASFTVTIGDNSADKTMVREVTDASDYGKCSDVTVSMTLKDTDAYRSVSATAKVYVYKAKDIVANTTVNTAIQEDDIGNTHVSGVMIKSGSVTGFRPYVQMKYDTLEANGKDLTAYVLGEETRELHLNSYAEVEWNKQPTPNLTLSSLQWSTHNEANKQHSPGTVLPGGATLTLSIRENHRQTVKVHTYQPVLEGAGFEQVDKTGGDTTKIATASQAQAAHDAFVEDVRKNLDSLHLQQWFANADYATNPGGDRTTSKDVFNNGGVVDNNKTFNGFGGSAETKYYFDNDTSTGGINGASNEGDLDAKTGTTTTRYYLFWCDPSGNIRMATGGSSIATWVPDGKF